MRRVQVTLRIRQLPASNKFDGIEQVRFEQPSSGDNNNHHEQIHQRYTHVNSYTQNHPVVMIVIIMNNYTDTADTFTLMHTHKSRHRRALKKQKTALRAKAPAIGLGRTEGARVETDAIHTCTATTKTTPKKKQKKKQHNNTQKNKTHSEPSRRRIRIQLGGKKSPKKARLRNASLIVALQHDLLLRIHADRAQLDGSGGRGLLMGLQTGRQQTVVLTSGSTGAVGAAAAVPAIHGQFGDDQAGWNLRRGGAGAAEGRQREVAENMRLLAPREHAAVAFRQRRGAGGGGSLDGDGHAAQRVRG